MKNRLKVSVLNGSLRSNGITYYKVEKIIKYMKLCLSEMNFELIIQYIEDNNISSCKGCEQCFFNGTCSIDDDIKNIKSKLLESDIIIVASPVYLNHITGTLKSTLDRIAYRAHLMPLLGKRGIIVVTASQSGLDETTEYLENILSYFGLSIDITLKYNRFEKKESLSNAELEYLVKSCIENALSNEKKLSERVTNIFEFYKEYFNQNSELLCNNFEFKYWKEKGHLEL